MYVVVGTCICVGVRSGFPCAVVVVLVVFWLLVSLCSFCVFSESTIVSRVYVPGVVGVQVQVSVVVAPMSRLGTFIFPIELPLTYSLTANSVAVASPLLVIVTFMG